MTTEQRLAELRAEWSRCHASGDHERAEQVTDEAARLTNPPVSRPRGTCNAATPTNTCSGEVRFYPAGHRCNGHSPAAMRLLLAERERQAR